MRKIGSLLRQCFQLPSQREWAQGGAAATATHLNEKMVQAWKSEAGDPKTFTLLKYYEFLRAEITREDNILNQRLTWMMAFQGFLFAAVGSLVSNLWSPPSGITFKLLLCLLIGAVGLALSVLSVSGVDAAVKSLEEIKNTWKAINDQVEITPTVVPQTFGRHPETAPFAELMPRVFVVAWVLFEIVAVGIIVAQPWTSPVPPSAAAVSRADSREWRLSITVSSTGR